MPVDPMKDFVPVANLVANQVVLAVNPALVPANDLREFVAFARASTKPLFYASIGNGSQHHLAMEMLKQHTGISLTHVPYKGGGPAAIAVVSGEVAAMFGGGSVVPLIKSGSYARWPRADGSVMPRCRSCRPSAKFFRAMR